MAVVKNKTLDTFDYEEKLINFIMKHGKKSVAKKIYADTLKDIVQMWKCLTSLKKTFER